MKRYSSDGTPLDTWPVTSEELEAVYRSAVAAVDRAKGRETK